MAISRALSESAPANQFTLFMMSPNATENMNVLEAVEFCRYYTRSKVSCSKIHFCIMRLKTYLRTAVYYDICWTTIFTRKLQTQGRILNIGWVFDWRLKFCNGKNIWLSFWYLTFQIFFDSRQFSFWKKNNHR